MSTGAVFKLIANDGKADRMIMATELLNQRIKDIMCQRAQAGAADPTPTLVDIERTHILFVNAHFKPFAAIGYEYNKVIPQGGSNNFGETVTFSIPQFGDFFHDMVANVSLGSFSATVGAVPALPTEIQGVTPTSLSATAAVTDMPVPNGTALRYTYQYVDQRGTALATTSGRSDFVRYCEYPGERLFARVDFSVNNNPLDDYNPDVVVMFRKFRVAPGKLVGWKRLMGQQVPKEATSNLVTVAGTSYYAANMTDLDEVGLPNGTPSVAPTSAVVSSQQLTSIVDGPQTPQFTQPALDLWIPLLFWFCQDARLSIASVSIPYGQRFINITMEQASKIVFTAPGNTWLQLTTENATGGGAFNTLPTLTSILTYNRAVTRKPVLCGSTVGTPNISKIQLYINNIFVNPEIHDIYIKRIGFSLIRVHRRQITEVADSTKELLLSNLKWPIETMYVGLRPKFNTGDALDGAGQPNYNTWRDWHRFTRLVDQIVDVPVQGNSLLTTGVTAPAVFASTINTTSQSTYGQTTWAESYKTVDRLTLMAHGIVLFNDFPSEFFSTYMPYQYGGYNIVVPDDEGALMVNFCLYPGTYQPSGHLNVSRAREFYISYVSSYVGAASHAGSGDIFPRAMLIVVAIAINFLLISDGSAILRYST